MNIAIITDTYFPDINGVTSSIYTLSEALKSQGHCVYIFTVSEPKSLLRKLKADPTVYRLPSLPLIFLKPHRAAVPFSVRMLRMMRKLKIDIIHTNNLCTDIGAMVGLIEHIPHVWHIREFMWKDFEMFTIPGPFAGLTLLRKTRKQLSWK